MELTNKSSTKAIWDKLETLNEGDPTVKTTKLDGYWVRFENLKIEEDERITAFIERVNEIVMGIQCCGGALSEEIVSKVLRALPPAYKMKATIINELRTMANTFVNRDTLVGKLFAFELEEFGPSGVVKSEPSFHASASSTEKQDWRALYAKELDDMTIEDEEFEQLEALFSRRVPKGPVGSKYEGKAPFNVLHVIRLVILHLDVLKGIQYLKKELEDLLSLTLNIRTSISTRKIEINHAT